MWWQTSSSSEGKEEQAAKAQSSKSPCLLPLVQFEACQGWGAARARPPLSYPAQDVCGEAGAKSPADELDGSQRVLRSRAAPWLPSIESHPWSQAFVWHGCQGPLSDALPLATPDHQGHGGQPLLCAKCGSRPPGAQGPWVDNIGPPGARLIFFARLCVFARWGGCLGVGAQVRLVRRVCL